MMNKFNKYDIIASKVSIFIIICIMIWFIDLYFNNDFGYMYSCQNMDSIIQQINKYERIEERKLTSTVELLRFTGHMPTKDEWGNDFYIDYENRYILSGGRDGKYSIVNPSENTNKDNIKHYFDINRK